MASRAELLHRLDAMGITTFVRRDQTNATSAQASQAHSLSASPVASAPSASATPTETAASSASPKAAPSSASPKAAPPSAPGSADKTSKATDKKWTTLANEVAACEQCVLHKTRTQTVFGVGARNAQWMFVGEGPGADEDAQGEPFVGRAGKLLTRMLLAIGFQRDEVYIANIVKCRPPDNRNPRPEEVGACINYLHRQIALVQPDIIVCLGGVAAHELLQTEDTVGRLRGHVHAYDNDGVTASVVVTYHPAYLLRSPNQKQAAWDDLQFACQTVGRAVPEHKPGKRRRSSE